MLEDPRKKTTRESNIKTQFIPAKTQDTAVSFMSSNMKRLISHKEQRSLAVKSFLLKLE